MKRLILFFLLVGAFNLSANGQVTLEECRQMARENHPAIRMYGLINATKDYSISNASRQWIPSIQFGALAGLDNNPQSISDLFSNTTHPRISQFFVDEILKGYMNISDMPSYSYKAYASLSQNIYDGGNSKTSKKIAQAQADVQTAETDVTLSQVCDRVDEIYFSIILLEKRILQIDSKLEVLHAVRDRMANMNEVGVSSQDETDEMAAACIEASQQKEDLECSLKSFRVALSLLVGKDLMSEELKTPSAFVQPQTDHSAVLLDRQADYLSLQKDKLDVALRPRLDLVADAYYGYPNRNIYKNFVSRDPGINAFVGLRLNWNLNALYTRKNDLAIISNSLEEINVKRDILKLDTHLRNNTVNSEVERLHKCIVQDNELITIRERLRKSAELAYSNGEIIPDKLLSRIDDEYQARLNAEIHEIECLRETYKLKEE